MSMASRSSHEYVNSLKRQVVITEDGEVFTWGDVDHLGFHEFRTLKTPKLVPLISYGQKKKAIMVSCGGCHQALIDEDARLWTCGKALQAGHNGNDTPEFQKQEYDSLMEPVRPNAHGVAAVPYRFIMVSCGLRHTMALQDSGAVWTWGAGNEGQLGLGNDSDVDHLSIVPGLSDKVIVMVAAGDHHSIALEQSGNVWTWGANFMSQLGLGDYNKRQSPECIRNAFDLQDPPEMIAGGGGHSAAISRQGVLWMWGNGMSGQLGLAQSEEYHGSLFLVSVPTVVEIPKCPERGRGDQTLTVSCGTAHTLVVKRNGSLWGCGSNQFGEIVPKMPGGPNLEDLRKVSFFTRLPSPFQECKFVSLCATFKGSSAVDSEGKLWSWGHGNEKCTYVMSANTNYGRSGDIFYESDVKIRFVNNERIGCCQDIRHDLQMAFCSAVSKRNAPDIPGNTLSKNLYNTASNQDIMREIIGKTCR